ncbi:MAG TPA: HNH endonuclease signature motif containing protein [Mycobacterium sp.]|uniref:HNH endonuclease signature motif containing protein n=1 Tax=Mycobacterium sp. TaxID=1785 RepID=UPI002CBFF2E7|nr:HNH endonuclease signature motif containing protein [Mycobacterium sp.]HME75441.1 HNH endonuclease signature motif containing protein [Mycobacterium sp.]
MFDSAASPQLMPTFVGVDDAGVVDAITDAARRQNAMCGRELAAVGELYARRAPEDDVDRSNWAIDAHENVVAEVAAALSISRGRARGRLRYAIALRERLPRVAEIFARGLIDFRMMAAVVSRTELVEDPVLIAKLDAVIARHAPKWMRFSGPKLFERIDLWVMRFDPAAKRVPSERIENRYVDIAPTDAGLAGVWAQLHATDGVALDRKLDALAETVCTADPRTKPQRRADALAALVAGLSEMRCECQSPDCAAAQRRPATDVVIHVLAEQATISGDSQSPGYLQTFGPLDSTTLRDMATTAKIKPLVMPPAEPERGYRASAALADFVRCRDLTCRFPGCDQPAEVCDLDHTVPFPVGPTHASNLKLLCRYHHLLKTFYTGSGGWTDRQLADGTVKWTAPSGHIYTTTPGGSFFFPVLATSTGELKVAQSDESSSGARGLMMPRRKRTRTEDRRYRIAAERRINEHRVAEERLSKQRRNHAAGADPPPF